MSRARPSKRSHRTAGVGAPSSALTEARARARDAADEAQRAIIAEATCGVIAAEGLDGASLRRIAIELGCTTGLVTHYFGSKDVLLVAVLRWAAGRLSEVVADGSPAEQLDLDAYLEYFLRSLPIDVERRNYWKVLLAFRAASIGDETLAEVYRGYSEMMESSLRSAVAVTVRRDLDDDDVVRITKGIGALLEGIGVSAAEDPDVWSEPFVRSIVAAAVDGFVRSSDDASSRAATPIGTESGRR